MRLVLFANCLAEAAAQSGASPCFFDLPHGFDEIVLEAWEGKDQLAADRLVYNTRFQKALFVNRDMGLGDLASRVFRFA